MTELKSKISRYNAIAETFHCDFRDRLFLGNLGNHMLNAADYHSNERGYGMHYLNTVHKTWVLSRFTIEMNDMPHAYDSFSVETWVEGVMRFFTSRNFAVRDHEGRALGYGRSVWAMIDTDTRQPVDILAVKDGLIKLYVDTDTPCPIAKPSRVKMDNSAKLVRTIDTFYHDVDLNGHINSVKYLEHALDTFTLDFFASHRVKRFDIAYVAESHAGDKLHIYRQKTGDEEYAIRMTKSNESEPDEVEVVRCIVNFVKE